MTEISLRGNEEHARRSFEDDLSGNVAATRGKTVLICNRVFGAACESRGEG